MMQSKLQKAAVCIFVLVAALFLIFFIYIDRNEGVSIYQARSTDSIQAVDGLSVEELQDASAPIGIRQAYRWTVADPGEDGTTLAFYLVHQYGEVYLDGELLYSLMPEASNTIGKSIGSNWITVPLYSGDAGKELCVVVTPVYESVRNRTVTFEVGSFFQVFEKRLITDLPILILSIFCCLLGLTIMAVQLILMARKKARTLDMLYLGCFTLLLGLWKVTDTRFSPFMFPEHTMLLGYLTIGALFLTGIPLAIYFAGCFTGSRTRPMLIVSIWVSGVSLAVLVLQVLGIADFRETLTLAHVSIIVQAVVLLVSVFTQRPRKKAGQPSRLLWFAAVLALGAAADLVLYYTTKSSSSLIFTLLAFMVYSLSLFIVSVMDTNKRAYTDAQTGLFNKRRWDNLMSSPSLAHESVGILMCDLNRLKYVNDTMGHDMGDKMILAFSNILRNTIPATNTICRWGGDEFAVLITGASAGLMEHYLNDMRVAVAAYNASGEQPEIHYAAGYALSEEFPELPLKSLFKQADTRMYEDKQRWYQVNDIKH